MSMNLPGRGGRGLYSAGAARGRKKRRLETRVVWAKGEGE
jgi:hypothetical protein